MDETPTDVAQAARSAAKEVSIAVGGCTCALCMADAEIFVVNAIMADRRRRYGCDVPKDDGPTAA